MPEKFTTYPTEARELATERTFVVLVNSQYTVGSFQDAETHSYMQYIQFQNERELNDWILQNHGKKTFKAIQAIPVTYKLTSTVTLKTE